MQWRYLFYLGQTAGGDWEIPCIGDLQKFLAFCSWEKHTCIKKQGKNV